MAADTAQGMFGPYLYSVLMLTQMALQLRDHHFIMVDPFL